MIAGRPLTPRGAKDLGLLDFVVPPDRLWSEVRDYAGRIAKEGVGAPLWTAFAWERERQNQLFEHPDCKEGVRAFFEKRPPRFGGA